MKRLLIITLLFISNISFGSPVCISEVSKLHTLTIANLEQVVTELASLIVDYQNLQSTEPHAVTILRIIEQKSQTLESLLRDAGYSPDQKDKIKGILLSKLGKLGENLGRDLEDLSRQEKEARREEEGIFDRFAPEKSDFTQSFNDALSSSTFGVDRLELSHDGRFYLAFHPQGVVIIDAETMRRVQSIYVNKNRLRNGEGGGPETVFDFGLSPDGRHVTYVQKNQGSGDNFEIYQMSVHDAVINYRPKDGAQINQDKYKVRNVSEAENKIYSWNLILGDSFLRYVGGKEFPTLIPTESSLRPKIEYIHPSFKANPDESHYGTYAIDKTARTLAISHGGIIGIYDMASGSHRFDLKSNDYFYFSKIVFSPDGTKLAALFDKGFVVWSLNQGARQKDAILFPEGADTVLWRTGAIGWAPDNRHLAVTLNNVNKQGTLLKVYRPELYSEPILNRVISDNRTPIFNLIFSPEGDRIIMLDGNGQSIIFKKKVAP